MATRVLGSDIERHEVHGATHGCGSGTTSGPADPAHQHHPLHHHDVHGPVPIANAVHHTAPRRESVHGGVATSVNRHQPITKQTSSASWQKQELMHDQGSTTSPWNSAPQPSQPVTLPTQSTGTSAEHAPTEKGASADRAGLVGPTQQTQAVNSDGGGCETPIRTYTPVSSQ